MEPARVFSLAESPQERVHEISVVIPVYQGEHTLTPLITELDALVHGQRTRRSELYQINEVILVHDGAIDRSDETMRKLASRYSYVRLIWLSRNFGQHAATLAGMATTTAEWVVTLDEDGQHNPKHIGDLLDRALSTGAQLVYASPANEPPHGWWRNRTSSFAKWLFATLWGNRFTFSSYRLIYGEIARGLAAYCGTSVYLDGALSWVTEKPQYCSVSLRPTARSSGYNWIKLLKHFVNLVLTSRRSPLRLIALMGGLSVLVSIGVAIYALWGKLSGQVPIPGWTSLAVLICFFSGIILLTLGILAEYLGLVLSVSMGKPLYLSLSHSIRNDTKDPP